MITSTGNPRVKEVRRLARGRERRAQGLTLLEGPHLVEAAVAAGASIREVWLEADDGQGADLAARAGVEPMVASPEVLKAISTTETTRGPIAVVAVPAFAPLSDADTIVLWNVADPGNAGTLIRSAAAFGWQVAVGPEAVDIWAPKVLRAGVGAHFSVAISSIDTLDELRRAGLSIVASTPRGGRRPDRLHSGAMALLIGNEPRGLPDEVVAAADHTVTIESGEAVESLNAAVAGSILMWRLSGSG
jgi:TrmH family RNA methyltransferase